MSTAARTLNRRRMYAPVVLVLLASGGLVFVAAKQAWTKATVKTTGLPVDEVSVSGADALPLVSALSVVVSAGALAIIAASVRLRRIIAGIVILTALGGIMIIATGGGTVDSAFERAVDRSPAFAGATMPEAQTSFLWPALAVFGFLVAFIAGIAALRWSDAWPTMSSRYDAPASHAPIVEAETDADVWKAQDEGQDPTYEP